jgi:hypothetical protein
VLALTFVASALLPSLAPVADAPHLLMILPVYLPLVGYGLSVRSADDDVPAPRRFGTVLLVSAWIVALATPFVYLLASSRLDRRPGVTFARATYITDRSPLGQDLHALVAYLQTHLGSGDRLLAVPSHAMLYFLTDHASALEEDEFWFYAATYGPQLSPSDARAFVDQGDAIRRLEAERPLIVRFVAAPGERAFRRAFPVLNRYIDRRYGSVATFGQYAVLAWRPRHESTRGLP